ncbi:hypothetical protein NQ317_019444 [Molorchus minor]|uniref:RecF/RecN/SMC N-terminal domain-containing protein n=1 Tax=Molorchus minor TaxID=1323400 RepID=A0ABQ9K0G4_9CUCU|nr:hypothetical protein NQ317_019444 [Molorchus minor]
MDSEEPLVCSLLLLLSINSKYYETVAWKVADIPLCLFWQDIIPGWGTIEINMHAKQLELIVIPQHGSQGHTTTSNLSGGERSFSTVAFLYALWQCMEFPFYFLDEFDVYMDKLNRSKVIDILIHHASSKPQLQFVFLTPQDVSFINKDVSILRTELSISLVFLSFKRKLLAFFRATYETADGPHFLADKDELFPGHFALLFLHQYCFYAAEWFGICLVCLAK